MRRSPSMGLYVVVIVSLPLFQIFPTSTLFRVCCELVKSEEWVEFMS